MMRVCHLGIGFIIGCILAFSGCATGPEVDETIKDSPRGSVYLERIADRSFRAAHPIKIDANTIALVLRGVYVREDQSALQNFFSGKPDALRAFSEEEVAFLTPLIAEGLMRAAPDQQVAFRLAQIGLPGHAHNTGGGVGSSEPPLALHPRESTTGVIHAYGRSLYVTISEYRLRPEPANTINMANRRVPDNTGLINHTVLFVPEAAKRPDSYLDAHSTDKTLAIDYELLASLPASTGSPPSQPSPSPMVAPPPPTTEKREPAKKEGEIEALRKELDEIKRQLAEQEAERTRSQKKSATPK
jgi:hypothetical protein